ncbi:hypothetical protein M8J76_014360 [Diaphorina citri]|nr:hypothetical protein M8J76_014360 [Diaphorina citri]
MELDVKKNTLDRSRSFNNDTRFPLALMRSKTSKSYSTKKAMFNQLNDEKPTMVDNMRTDSLEETISDELSYKVCKESIRASLLEAMKMSSGDVNVLYAIENSLYEPDEMATLFSKASQAEKTTALLWCVFVKREDLLDALHQLGADLSNDKYGALHLAAFNGSIKGCSWLMLHGHDINFTKDSYTPLHFAVLGNYVDCAKFLIKNKAHIHETIVHSAVSTNAVDCVQLLLSLQINPNVLNNKGVSPLHIAADRGLISCLKAILDSGMADVDIKTKERRVTALHLAAENGYVECLRILLENHANCNERNHKEQIPLHLAAKCQSVECMEMLLRKGSQVNASDCDNRTPLHASLSKNILSVHPLEILLKWGANVNARDIFGYSPIHIAALSELSQCVDCLIMHGADISSKTPSGSSALSIIMRNTPSSISSVRKKLDSSISLQDPEASTKDIELKLNFKYILQNGPDGEIVQDIQGLHKTAGLDKLVRQTELIHSLELALFQGYLPNRIVSMLKSQALLTPSSYTVALNVKPLNPRETRLPKEVMLNALDIARQRRIDPHFIWASGFKNTSDEYKLLLQELHSLHDVLNEQQNTLNNIMKHMGIEKH